MKRLGMILGGLLLVAVVAVMAIPFLLNVNRYHDRIQSELESRLGRSVELGNMRLSLLPPAFKVENARIGEDPRFPSSAPFAQAAELDIELKPQPLLHRQIEIASLRMVHPQLELIRAVDGVWNFSSLGQSGKPSSGQPSSNTPLRLSRLQIDDGQLAVTDLSRHQPRIAYSHIDAQLRDLAPDTPFTLALSAHLPGGTRQVARLDLRGGPIQDATLVSTPLDGSLELDQVALSSARQYLNSDTLNSLEGVLAGKLNFRSEAGKVTSNGSLRADNVASHGQALGFPIELDLNASDDLHAETVTLSNTRLKLGTAPFVLSGTLDTHNTPAQANLHLTAEGASVAELVKLAAVGGVQLSPGMNPTGRLSANLTAKGALAAPAISGTLTASQLAISGVTANTVTVNLALAPPGAELVKTLNGRVAVNLADGKLTGVDLAQQLGSIGKFTGANKISDGVTHVSSLTGTFDLHNGIASTNDLKALTDAGTVAATGTASLADQGLDLRATAVLSKTSSQQVGGTAIGGLMNTALANSNGEIVIPVLVTGTIPSPKVSPDLTAMAKLRVSHLLPSFGNPGQLATGALSNLGGAGGAGGVLGALTGQGTPAAAANGQPAAKGNSAQDTVNGLVGLFGKKPKK